MSRDLQCGYVSKKRHGQSVACLPPSTSPRFGNFGISVMGVVILLRAIFDAPPDARGVLFDLSATKLSSSRSG